MNKEIELTPEERASMIYVHIVESPDAETLRNKTYEGKRLHDMLELAGITSEHYIVENKEDFEKQVFSLPNRVLDYKKKGINKVSYILHISAHGNEEGISLTDDTIIGWDELVGIIKPVNESLASLFNLSKFPGMKYILVVALSTCKGFHGLKMTLESDEIPFRGLVGPEESVTWLESALAYLILYHQHANELNKAPEITRVMTEATGKKFTYIPGALGQEIRKSRTNK